eukprot:m.936948 g.936948  ORF g.936948 m.936948 type:complete len:75 (-) comp226157_c0_seq1:235-459(-)
MMIATIPPSKPPTMTPVSGLEPALVNGPLLTQSATRFSQRDPYIIRAKHQVIPVSSTVSPRSKQLETKKRHVPA